MAGHAAETSDRGRGIAVTCQEPASGPVRASSDRGESKAGKDRVARRRSEKRPKQKQQKHASRRRLLPEDYLERAMAASTPGSRGRWASRGLAYSGSLNRTTHAMLLRQLYLSRYTLRRFEQAYEIAQQALQLDVLVDVMHQDAARAKQATGDVDTAVGHLRLAVRLGPPSRRAFHYWTLGSLLYLADRQQEAVAALTRAARWGTTDKPLYQGHLALAKSAAGRQVRQIGGLIARLEKCPAGQGYGRFVLGQLAFRLKQWDKAARYLEAFLKRTEEGRRATAISLEGEVKLARETLRAIPR